MNKIEIWFDKEKNIKKEEYWVNENNQLNGRYQSWHPRGHPERICFYINGELHGRLRWWFWTGQLWKDSFYKNGKLHGRYYQWYYNSYRRKDKFYINGRLHGRSRWWSEDGIIYRHGFYINGEKHGRYQYWHRNDQVGEDCFYKKGTKIMEFEEYAEEMNRRLDAIGKIMISRYDSDKNLDSYWKVIHPELFGIISDYALYKKIKN